MEQCVCLSACSIIIGNITHEDGTDCSETSVYKMKYEDGTVCLSVCLFHLYGNMTYEDGTECSEMSAQNYL